MEALNEIKSMLCREIDSIAEKGELTAGQLDTVDKLIHAYKNIEKIEEMNGYSSSGDWTASGKYGRDYSRGRHYVRGHYSYRDGKERLMSQMDDMMREGSLSDHDRDCLSKAMNALR